MNRFKQQEQQRRVETTNAILRRASDVLLQVGMPTAAEHVRCIADETKAAEFMDMAIQAGVAAETEKIVLAYAAKRVQERMEDRLAYELALASVGTSGWTTCGYRTFYG